ncbi:hypothetical protein IFR05_017157 [Cadophora sp. M221]|nr:hypothetical protein IFR05_017157 [Cadophora sp. M221]
MAMDDNMTAADQASTAASGFPQFQHFPLEIRQLIWEAALPGPRVVMIQMRVPHDGICDRVRSDIDISDSSNNDFFDFGFMVRHRQFSPSGRPTSNQIRKIGPVRSYVPKLLAKTPVITAVCLESRAMASMFYTLAFGSSISPPYVWFSFDRDTLHMPEHVIAGFERDYYSVSDLGPDFEKVKHLSIAEPFLDYLGDSSYNPHPDSCHWYSKTISRFSSLQSLTYALIVQKNLFGDDLILVNVQDVATALAFWISFQEPLGHWDVKCTRGFRTGWEVEVVQALINRVVESSSSKD